MQKKMLDEKVKVAVAALKSSGSNGRGSLHSYASCGFISNRSANRG